MSDESQFRIVLRGPVGQRVEKTEQQVAEVERVLRAQIPAEELETIVSSTGVLAQGRSSLFNPNTGPHTSSHFRPSGLAGQADNETKCKS